jgi:hypothetical protein
MTSDLEYDVRVRYSVPATVAAFAVLAFCIGAVSISHAQINGAPASVTSQGFGGRVINGTAPSVTSLGPNGTAPNQHGPFGPGHGPVPGTGLDGDGHHHHHHDDIGYPVGYVYGVPYAVDLAPADDAQADPDDDPNYQGGPTVFDRRGSGADSYVPPVKDVPKPHSLASADDDPASASLNDPPPQQTVLVFKDGHQVEVSNYAIVGATLFDLTPGHARKVALADLDLGATQQQNEDHGVVFELPTPSQAN